MKVNIHEQIRLKNQLIEADNNRDAISRVMSLLQKENISQKNIKNISVSLSEVGKLYESKFLGEG